MTDIPRMKDIVHYLTAKRNQAMMVIAGDEMADVICWQADRIKELEEQIASATMQIHAATPDGVVEIGQVVVTIDEGE